MNIFLLFAKKSNEHIFAIRKKSNEHIFAIRKKSNEHIFAIRKKMYDIRRKNLLGDGDGKIVELLVKLLRQAKRF